jgi:multiple sugar transport system substrate-binding protein
MISNRLLLRGITWDHVRGYGPLEASAVPYKEKTGIHIQWDKRSLKDFGDTSLEKLAHDYDLIIMDHPHCGMASAKRCVLPLDKILDHNLLTEVASNTVGPSFTSYLYDNHQWALPIDAACQVSCCRQDLLDGFTPPQNWGDVFDLATLLKSRRLFIGTALCPTDCNCCFLTLCAQFGNAVEEGKFTSAEIGKHAIRILKKLFDVSHPKSKTWNPIRLYDHMSCEDDVAYSPIAFGYTNYARKGYSNHQLLFGTIPGYHSAILGGAGIAVSAYSQSPNEAVTYAAWLCSENYQASAYVTAGGQPAHCKAWTSAKANELTGHFFSETRSTIESAYVRPRNLQWPLFQEELGEIIHKGLITNMSVEKIWNGILEVYQRFYGLRFEV